VLLFQFQLHLHSIAKVCKVSRWLLSVARSRGITASAVLPVKLIQMQRIMMTHPLCFRSCSIAG